MGNYFLEAFLLGQFEGRENVFSSFGSSLLSSCLRSVITLLSEIATTLERNLPATLPMIALKKRKVTTA